MGELQLTLTQEERDILVNFLQEDLKEARVEEHRTRTPSYREYVSRTKEVIAGILTKLGQTPA